MSVSETLPNTGRRNFAQPEVILPRGRRGAGAFNDENLDLLSHVLDDWFRIPGTSIRFGIDGIVGLIPGVGDVLGGLASCIIVLAAWFRGVPNITVARMIVNVATEVLLGMIPFVGDLFDIAFKANRRNYALLAGSLHSMPRSTTRDWLFFGVLALFMLALTMLPVFLMAKLVSMMVLAGLQH
jgi:hypothetical protein